MLISSNKKTPKTSKSSTSSKRSKLWQTSSSSKEQPQPIEKNVSNTKDTSKISEPDIEIGDLKERRAVSESRFKLMEQNKENENNPEYNFTRAKSDHDIERRRNILSNKSRNVNSDSKSGGAISTTVDINSLKEKFEGKSPPPPISEKQARPVLPKDSITLYTNKGRGYIGNAQPGNYPKQRRPGSGEGSSNGKGKAISNISKRAMAKSQSPLLQRIRQENEMNTGDNSTTATESEIEGRKKRDRGGRPRKGNGKSPGSRSSGSKRQQHSGCEACNSDREHKEHKKEKRRQRREKEKSSKSVLANAKPVIPPPPKSTNIDERVRILLKRLWGMKKQKGMKKKD